MKENVAKSNYYRKGTIVCLLFSTFFFLTGCLEELELDEKVIVAMVGVDQTEKGTLNITMGVIDTRSIEEMEPRGVKVFTVEGDTIFEAVRSSIQELGRQPQWPYIKVIVFGPAFSEADIAPILDFFNRNNEVQPNPHITFSHEFAKDIVNLDTDLANIPGVIVESQFKLQNLVGYTPSIELHEFTEMMHTPEKVGFAAIIKTENENKGPMINGTAVIKEGKWIGDLSNIESRGLLWVRDEVRGGIIVIPSIEGVGKIGLEIIDESEISIEPSLKNGELSIEINLEQLVSISEVMANIDLTEKNLRAIKQETEKEIIKEVETTLEKAQAWGTDIFDIGRAVHRKYPKYWKEHKDNWGETFATLPIDINVHIDIKTLGLLRSIEK